MASIFDANDPAMTTKSRPKFPKSHFLVVALSLIMGVAQSWAQVTTEPVVPNAAASVIITFDATKGTAGLKDCNCDVFIHIGAVTEGPTSTTWTIIPFQWGTNNPLAKMTKVAGQTNLYTYELTPNQFFANPSGLTIFRLGMVFRNVDGTKEGKGNGGTDMFVNLAQGFQVTFTDPQANALSLEVGQSFEFKVAASEPADISMELNGIKVAEAANVETLSYTFIGSEGGNYQLVAKATKGVLSDTESLNLTVFAPSLTAPLPAGAKLGINYLSDTEVLLALQAPKKSVVHLIGDFNDWQVLPDYQLARTPDKEVFWIKLSGLTPKKEYIFQYLVDGEIRIGDPYADKISDPFDDQQIISEGRYPGLLPYPSGKSQFQATYFQTDQDSYVWKNQSYTRPQAEQLVIYELLVRDFDNKRTYNAVIDRLDYIKSLGVNAIELMPVGEFEGNLSWGYNPSFFFAPDKYYGTKNDLKRLIDEAHGKGIVIILDMVLNHAFGQNPMVRLYNTDDYGAPTAENPWFNTTATHPFSVGYDFNHESKYTKAFVDSVNNYWLTEYKVDGFRFDLSKGFTQVDAGGDVGKWSQYDASRIKIWKHIYDRIRSNHPEAYIILEHLSDNTEEKELSEHGMMLWGNMNFDFREIAKGGNRDLSSAYFQNRGWSKNHLVAYQESHDEERVMWETLTFGATTPVNLKELENAVNRNQLMTAFYFGFPGPKMVWQFGEFGYDLELNNDRLAIKPTKWEYLDDPQRQRLLRLYQEMIKLKGQFATFNTPTTATMGLSSLQKTITLEHPDLDVVLVGNFSLQTVTNVTVNFPKPGKWYNYFTGEEVTVSGVSLPFSFRPNEFILFTNKKLPAPTEGILQPDFVTGIPESGVQEGFQVYPVPTQGTLTVELPSDMVGASFRMIDLAGRVIFEGKSETTGEILDFDLGGMNAGIYIFEAYGNSRFLYRRVIKY